MAFESRGAAPGVAFSPIPSEKTMEDLPALLARLFGGPSEGTGVKRLPGLTARGVLPDEVLRMFLESIGRGPGGGVQRPGITELLPTAPEVPGGPPAPPASPPGAPVGATPPPPPPVEPPTLEDVFAPQQPALAEPPAATTPPAPTGPSAPGAPERGTSDIINEIFSAPESSTESPSQGSTPELPTAPGPGQGPTRGSPFSGGQFAGDTLSDVEYTNEPAGGGGGMTPEEFMEMILGNEAMR